MPKFGILESLLLLSGGDRHLQELPDYTSPPLPIALEVTPESFRSDDVIDSIRDKAASGNCTTDVGSRCHIPFPAPEDMFESDSEVGVVFYPGGLVDPRGYSVIADLLATRYGLPTVITVFDNDLAFTFGTCDSGRLDMAKAEFPNVKKWVLAGHSFGGIGASTDMWVRWNNGDDSAAGLAMLAADIRPDLGCGIIDFSNTSLPMASVIGSVDGVLNSTRWQENTVYLSNETQMVEIYGGPHGHFGAYDDSARFDILGQTDGEALIPSSIAWDLITAAIVSVASRTGVPLPVAKAKEEMDAGVEVPSTEPPTQADTSVVGDRPRCGIDIDDDGSSDSSGHLKLVLDFPLAAALISLGTILIEMV